MWRYYLLLTDAGDADIAALRRRVETGELHPKQAKVDLARRIVSDFHSLAEADRAAERFEARFGRGELATDELREMSVVVGAEGLSLARLIVDAGLAASTSEASRKVQQGGVKVDRERATDPRARVDAARGGLVLEVGRRAVRIRLS
jgi:tyrosyl-tRNA synthetase